MEGRGAISPVESGLGVGAAFIKQPTLFSCSPGAGERLDWLPQAVTALERVTECPHVLLTVKGVAERNFE